MKGNLKITALAAAVATFAMGTAAAQVAPPEVTTAVDTDVFIWGDIEAVGEVAVGGELLVGGNVNLDYNYDYDDNFERNVVINDNFDQNVAVNDNFDRNVVVNDNFDRNVVVNDNTDRNVVVNDNFDQNVVINDNLDRNVTLDQSVDETIVRNDDRSYTEDVTYTADVAEDHTLTTWEGHSLSTSESHNLETNSVTSNIVRNEFGRTDVRGERDVHGMSVNIDKSLSLSSDIAFSGAPTITGEIDLDSAAIAVVDNRQSNTENVGVNDMLTNEASIDSDVGSAASGNLQFNVAAGDNNVQDNAAALAAADAGFSFGLADAEVFVNQNGSANTTVNLGVTNNASLSANAFSDASGNIGVNIASGNNNMQKNAMTSSVATAAYAQASVSSNQISTGNAVSNTGVVEELTGTIDVELTGTVGGGGTGPITGTYEGSSAGGYAGTGNSYQSSNFYADMWEGEDHPTGPSMGHADFDSESVGAVANPFRDGVGGLGFDNEDSGDYEGSESGTITLGELSFDDLATSLAGTVTTTQWLVHDATNTASLSDSAFANASGNIGVNLAAGSGNLQANSLSMAVAQPGSGAAPPPTNGGGE